MISGRPPTRRAMTGVPQASASIATSPNGSGQEPGHQRRVRLGEQLVALAPARARRGTRPASRPPCEPARRRSRSSRARRRSGRPSPRSGAAGRSCVAISIASTIPFSGATRPTKQSASPRRRSNGASSSVSPLWTMPAHGDVGCVEAWFWLIATRPASAARTSRPPTAGRAGRGRSRRPGSARRARAGGSPTRDGCG